MASDSHWDSEIIGYFSVDEHRNYVANISGLLYYYPRKMGIVRLDLNEGYKIAVPFQESVKHERLEYLLEWIKLNRSKIETPLDSGEWIKPHFVCPAGLYSKILRTPFEPNNDWILLAVKWKGTIYLYVDKTNNVPKISDEFWDKTTTWGFKFQQLMLSKNPCEESDTSKPVIHSKEFRCVYQHQLGNHMILFDNVMKGVCSDKRIIDPLTLRDLKFIEIATNRVIENWKHKETLLKRRFLEKWSRGFITNMENVVIGFRNDYGIVRELKTFGIDEMAEMSKAYWNPSDCLNFAENFFTQLRKFVVDECDKTIYRFERTPTDEFSNQQIIMATKLLSSAENNLLPDWYMKETEKP